MTEDDEDRTAIEIGAPDKTRFCDRRQRYSPEYNHIISPAGGDVKAVQTFPPVIKAAVDEKRKKRYTLWE
jgi:hypothetical protein